MLLDARVSLTTGEGEKVARTLAEVLHRISKAGLEASEAALLDLQWYGLRLVPADGAIRLAIANDHPRLKQLFTGSLWAGGGWKEALHRATDAQPGIQRFCKVVHRCTTLPLAAVLALGESTLEGEALS